MRSRREFLQLAAVSASYFAGTSNFARAAARQVLTQDDLLKFESKGQVTLLHITDMHGQLNPVYFRPPSENYGVGAFEGVPPHLVVPNSWNILTFQMVLPMPTLTLWLITFLWLEPMGNLVV